MKQALIFLTLLLAASLALAEECDKPYKVDVPDGASSDKSAMVTTQRAIKQYMGEAESYLACLEEKNRQLATAILSEEAIDEQRALTTRRHNAMVDEMELVAEEFNAEVRAYKSANPG